MVKKLVIVESPAKVKTINKILGENFKVVSSMGHLIDLPKSTLGVDVESNFEPTLIVLRNKQKILTQLKKEMQSKKVIYIATDPDREGEAIGWNIIRHIADGQKVYRVTFQEITKEAVLKAFENPRDFDPKKIDAQIARRILDRIVGYKISPILWKKVGSRLSAGRVQSVALRLIVEREREIQNFTPIEYWQIAVDLKKSERNTILTAELEKINGQKAELKSQAETEKVVAEIRKNSFVVSDIAVKSNKRKPSPPFITSTLQQEAFNKLGFNANKTMLIAQQLYEGVDIGQGETVGLITYMRTDSVNISQEAIKKVRTFIEKEYGKDYLPKIPNVYRSKKSAQEAHEAIRPSDVHRTPVSIRNVLDQDQYTLYHLIWKRFISCQMTPAVYEQTKMEIQAGSFQFGISGSILIFPGFLTLEEDIRSDQPQMDFSPYQRGDALELLQVHPSQHFTKPPPRFSDASLVKTMEEKGIGRPSTYASIIYTLVMRNYATREKGYYKATDLGIKICDLLVEHFVKIMDIGFTALMEENLDLVEEGKLDYVQLLRDFYNPFKDEINFAMKNIVKTEEFYDKTCPKCGKKMVVKWGRRGRFLSCSGFPQCVFSESFPSGVKCPLKDCGGDLVQRRSKRGIPFYGCSHYPKCTFIANKLPSGDHASP